jgi:hypothetical protein
MYWDAYPKHGAEHSACTIRFEESTVIPIDCLLSILKLILCSCCACSRYEIKFLVDGEWHVSPDLPTVGEGLTKNNLLVVDRF